MSEYTFRFPWFSCNQTRPRDRFAESIDAILATNPVSFEDQRVRVTIRVCPPPGHPNNTPRHPAQRQRARMQMDIQNVIGPICNALESMNIIHNDSQIDDLRVTRVMSDDESAGWSEVTISALEATP